MDQGVDSGELERLVERQRALLAINRAVSGSLDRDALIATIEKSLSPYVPMEMGMLVLPGPPEADYEIHAAFGVSSSRVSPGIVVSDQTSMIPGVLESGELVHFRSRASMVAAGGRAEIPEELGIESGLIIPLPCGPSPIGALAFASPQIGHFDDVDLAFVSEVADLLASALANSLTYEENRRLKDRLTAENRYLRDTLPLGGYRLVGDSDVMQRLRTKIATVAATDTTVLICGDTGTGKELVANEVHRLSHRSARPFIKVNCAALAGSLAESELFGHVRGAFTDAKGDRRGRFELADGGTLFLDEVGELTPQIQAALLRALQQGEIEPVGGSSALKVDVRIVAATNRDLTAMIAEGAFRQDLYYRLNVLSVDVPPLADRRDDIPQLVAHLLGKSTVKLGKVVDSFSDEAMAELANRDWPGNVRELQNVVERAVILAKGPVADLPPVSCIVPTQRAESRLDVVERNHIRQVLAQRNWVIAGPRGAAVALGLNPSTLRSRMNKLGIARESSPITAADV